MNKETTVLDLYFKDLRFKNKNNKDISICYEEAKNNKKAFNKIIEKNLGLVVRISKRYATKSVPLEDIIQDGNMGLIEAINRFDESKGYKFSTYARWWIICYINKGLLDKKRIIKFPPNKERDLDLLEKTKSILFDRLGRNPSRKELTKELNLKDKYISILENMAIYNHVSYEVLNNLEEPCKKNDMEVNIDKYFLKNSLSNILDKINNRDSNIVKCLYGICGEEKISIENTAIKFNLTESRIRQIKKEFLVTAKKRYNFLKNYI